MSKKETRILMTITIAVMPFVWVQSVNAMHIMEGFLPLQWCIGWGVLCIPFLAAGFLTVKKIIEQHRKSVLILSMAGAFAFVLSSLKIPSVTGSSSHATGTGLGAILFGPAVMAVLGLIVLLFQALLLAHGGLTTLGANVFSMAIAGPFVAYGVYKLCQKCKVSKHISIFMAAAMGDLITYCVTSIQLGLAHPSAQGGIMASVMKFMGIFAITQIPLAIIEGMITVAVVIGLEAYAKPELREIGYFVQEGS